MASVFTQDGYLEGGMLWKLFPTLGHPPWIVFDGEDV